MTINECALEDSGDYELQLTNDFGKITSSVTVNVKTVVPYFAQPLGNVVMEQSAIFETTVAGIPLPQVFWYRGDEKLEECEKYHMEFTDNGQVSLTISDINSSDILCQYSCKAVSVIGEVQVSAELQLQGLLFVECCILLMTIQVFQAHSHVWNVQTCLLTTSECCSY